MGYKLFIDDERTPVGDDWIVARSSSDAMAVAFIYGIPDFISFDHDLGGDDTTMVFLKWLAEFCLNNKYNFDFEYEVHSQNPVGRDNIIGFIESFKRGAE